MLAAATGQRCQAEALTWQEGPIALRLDGVRTRTMTAVLSGRTRQTRISPRSATTSSAFVPTAVCGSTSTTVITSRFLDLRETSRLCREDSQSLTAPGVA